MKNKILFVIVAVAILVGGFGYGLWKINNRNNNVLPQSNTSVVTKEDPVIENGLQPKHIPEGWNAYVNNEWGIALAYPTDWEFNESKETGLVSLKYRCVPQNQSRICDYDIRFSNGTGGGLPELTWTHPEYTIGGIVAPKTWQSDRPGWGDGYVQIIVVNGFQFWIYTPDKTKEISDRILSTVTFRKQ